MTTWKLDPAPAGPVWARKGLVWTRWTYRPALDGWVPDGDQGLVSRTFGRLVETHDDVTDGDPVSPLECAAPTPWGASDKDTVVDANGAAVLCTVGRIDAAGLTADRAGVLADEVPF